MRWFSERSYSYNVTNPTNQLSVNYLPALVKQHDYSLANIYLYQTFPGLTVENYQDPLVKAGEIGQVVDFFYNFKKVEIIHINVGVYMIDRLISGKVFIIKGNDSTSRVIK